MWILVCASIARFDAFVFRGRTFFETYSVSPDFLMGCTSVLLNSFKFLCSFFLKKKYIKQNTWKPMNSWKSFYSLPKFVRFLLILSKTKQTRTNLAGMSFFWHNRLSRCFGYAENIHCFRLVIYYLCKSGPSTLLLFKQQQ
jgi:hypothetical protein